MCIGQGLCSLQAPGSPAVANRPAEAARCFRSHVRASGRTLKMIERSPSESAGFGESVSAHTAGPYQYATNASWKLDGREQVAP